MARRGLDSHRALEVCVFGIGEGELAIILVFGFLLFGPDKLPQMGRTIGRAIRQFKETQEKMTAVVQSEIIDPVSEAAQAPLKSDDADDDADDDETSESGETAHVETFAERRARLAAEKAAAAVEGADAEGEGDVDSDSDSDDAASATDSADESVAAAEPAEAEEPAVEPEPEVRTTADLYARRPRKHKAVVEELAAELAAEEAEEAAANDAAAGNENKGGDE